MSLSWIQQKKFIRIVLVLIFLGICWLLFAPKMGVISLQKENSRLDALIQEKNRLREENEALRQEIEKIRNDIEYFEKLAREKHGLLKKNEFIFDFTQEKKKKE